MRLFRGRFASLALACAPADFDSTHGQIEAVLDALERAERPIYLHCRNGQDRVGAIIALYRMRHGASREQAFFEMFRHGFHPYPGIWRAYWREAAHIERARAGRAFTSK